jgi:uncharacterized protein YndB with AHSA1/START domain
MSELASARVQHVMPAPPEVVYDAWVQPESLAGFVCPAPGTAEVRIDPRVGGALRIEMTFPDRSNVIEGEYLLLERPHQISFSWRSLRGGFDSVVTVSLEPHGDGETLMTIVHSRLPQTSRDDHLTGWRLIAGQLASRLGGQASA